MRLKGPVYRNGLKFSPHGAFIILISRYITKDVAQQSLAVTSILLLIALSNRFVLYLAKVANGTIPLSLMFKIITLTIPGLLSQLLPLAFFIGLILSYGRLYADSEMTAITSAGISPSYLKYLTLKQALPCLLMCGFLSLWLVPTTARLREQVLKESEATGILQTIKPGRFQTLNDGRVVFYVESQGSDQEMRNIFIAEQPSSPGLAAHEWILIAASRATLEAQDARHYYLSLHQGQRIGVKPGQLQASVIDFAKYGRAILPEIEPLPNLLKLKPTWQLIKSHAPADQAEWQWRLSLPFTIPILALSALRMSRLAPRQGRFAKFLPAILFYIVYLNVLLIARRWGGLGAGPPWLGMLLAHGFFFMMGSTDILQHLKIPKLRT